MAQESPRSRQRKFIRQGRPLWQAELSWTLPNSERLAQLRYWLDGLEGYSGSAQIWDFASPRPDGITLATPGNSEPVRVFWTYLGNRAPWTWAGLPSHWALDATVALSGASTAGLYIVNVGGFQASSIAAVQGQYVQIGRRLYVVAATVMSNGGGVATLSLTTPILVSEPDGTIVRLVEAACEMELVGQTWGASARAGEGLISLSASFRETVTDKS